MRLFLLMVVTVSIIPCIGQGGRLGPIHYSAYVKKTHSPEPVVYIFGFGNKNVKRPGAYRFYPNMTLRELLNFGGAICSPNLIDVLRPTTNNPDPPEGQSVFRPSQKTYGTKNYKDETSQFILKPGDLVLIHSMDEWKM